MVHQQTDEPVGKCGPLVKRLRHRPLTPVTGVRFPHGSPSFMILTRNRTREGFDRKEKRKAVFRSKGRSGWSASRADSVSWLPIPPRVTIIFLHIYFDIRGRKSFDIQSVIITLRIHLFPFRTQKLSSAVPKILGGKLPGKIGRRRHNSLCLLH